MIAQELQLFWTRAESHKNAMDNTYGFNLERLTLSLKDKKVLEKNAQHWAQYNQLFASPQLPPAFNTATIDFIVLGTDPKLNSFRENSA